jgi:hypothetical protein
MTIYSSTAPGGQMGSGDAKAPPFLEPTRRSRVPSGADDPGDKLIRPAVVTDAEGWASASGLNQREAEELLDWLEANGFSQREVLYTDTSGITVRWKR